MQFTMDIVSFFIFRLGKYLRKQLHDAYYAIPFNGIIKSRAWVLWFYTIPFKSFSVMNEFYVIFCRWHFLLHVFVEV